LLYHSGARNFLLPGYVQILRAWWSRGHRWPWHPCWSGWV